tara:strand:+ start:5507 stop:5899 length:393 start_codon:yes stop_codon:yes gene_type:complete
MKKTSANTWNLLLKKYKSDCQKIISLSKSIRYIGIINEHGRTLTGKINSGVKPLLSPNQVRSEFFAITTTTKLRERSLTAIGEFDHAILNHKKIIILLFQNKKITYYITFGPKSSPSNQLINKIKAVIEE